MRKKNFKIDASSLFGKFRDVLKKGLTEEEKLIYVKIFLFILFLPLFLDICDIFLVYNNFDNFVAGLNVVYCELYYF